MKKLLLLALLALPAMGSAQLINADFEQWVNPMDSFVNRPTGWTALQPGAIPNPDVNFYHLPATDAYSNDYALRLSIWYDYTKDLATQTVPINYRPASLKGHYKYTDNTIIKDNDTIPDTAQVSIYLTKHNTVTTQQDTIGSGIVDLNQSLAYTEFTVAVTYTSNEIPDTVNVVLDPSLLRRYPDEAVYSTGNVTSLFTVDKLHLTQPSLSTINTSKDHFKAYPNPTTDVVNFPGFEGNVTVYDINGRQLLHQKVRPESGISLAQLPAGLYIVQLTSNDNKVHYTKIEKL